MYEKGLTAFLIYLGFKIGFYGGDPTKLVDDLQELKPNMLAGVPRIYQRIYSILIAKFNQLTGCKRWISQRALKVKKNNVIN